MKTIKSLFCFMLGIAFVLSACTPSQAPVEIQKVMDSHCSYEILGEKDFEVFTLDNGGTIIGEGKSLESEITVPLPAGEYWLRIIAGPKVTVYFPKITPGGDKSIVKKLPNCNGQWYHFILKDDSELTFTPVK